jgi:hypothetical protein
MIDERKFRYLMARQARDRWAIALQSASRKQWLVAAPMSSAGGAELVRFTRGAEIDRLASIAAARRKHGDSPDPRGMGPWIGLLSRGSALGFTQHEIDVDEPDFSRALADAVGGRGPADDARVSWHDHGDFEIEELVATVRSLAEPYAPDEVATALLLAKAVSGVEGGCSTVIEALNAPRPIVVVIAPVQGTAHVFLRMIEQGLIFGGEWEFRSPSGAERGRIAITRSAYKKSLVSLQCGPDGPKRPSIEKAFEAPLPILVTAAASDHVPARLLEAATLVLDTRALDSEIVHRLIENVRGAAPSIAISDNECLELDMTDVRMACRPGLLPNEIVTTLARYAIENRTSDDGDAEDSDRRELRPGQGRATGRAMSSTFIEPSTDPHAPRVETLEGYGAAREWALALKDDINAWKAGSIAWSDLSPRLLLSGPPGTGKTMWAKALGNSLGLPVLATSAATWLTAGHLGDVLAAMNGSFQDAIRRRPSVLFIDEIDGIGRRDTGRIEYDDYWVSIVNKALELLDGAIRSEGVVIVGATNRPDVLDPALRRSGRLERHIVIPKPNLAALAAIFRHHLGDAVEGLATEWSPSGETPS